jgi:hypothetical protein
MKNAEGTKVSARMRKTIQREMDSWSECTCDTDDVNCPFRFPVERALRLSALAAELARCSDQPAPTRDAE